MKLEIVQSEIARLRKEQSKTRQDEVFGGLSDEERAVYELKEERIRELELHLGRSTLREPSSVA